MSQSPPTNMDELNARFMQNHSITGFGPAIAISVPCPLCAAAGWAEHKLLEMQEVLSKEHTCKECGRSFKMIFDEQPHSTSFEIVQTAGDDQPEWFPLKIRRVDA